MVETIGTTRILRTPSPEYDVIATIAADRFDVPIALVNVEDGDDVWMKAKVGLELSSAPKSIAFCGHVLETAQPLVIEDLAADSRFADHPLVVGEMRARFYAGVPLIGRDGSAFGTLCIIDRRPREFGERELRALTLMAGQGHRAGRAKRTASTRAGSRGDRRNYNRRIHHLRP